MYKVRLCVYSFQYSIRFPFFSSPQKKHIALEAIGNNRIDARRERVRAQMIVCVQCSYVYIYILYIARERVRVLNSIDIQLEFLSCVSACIRFKIQRTSVNNG